MNNSSSKSILSLEIRTCCKAIIKEVGILGLCIFETSSSITARNNGKNENGDMNKGTFGGGNRSIYFQAEDEILK